MNLALGTLETRMFSRHFKMEGETLSVHPNDIPDAVLSSEPFEDLEYVSKKLTGRLCVLPDDIYKDLFPFPWVEKDPSDTQGFISFRYFDGVDWRPQTLVGVELQHLLSGDLGPLEHAGMAIRPVERTKVNEVYEEGRFISLLRQCEYRGFVTVRFNLPREVGDVISIRSVDLSAPDYALAHVIEGCKERTMDYFVTEGARLFDSWTTSLVLYRWPYPQDSHGAVKQLQPVHGLTNDVLKHFWPIDIDMYRKARNTTGGLLGVASAWNEDLRQACNRVIHTLMNLEVEGKFYRVDLLRRARWTAERMEEAGVF